MRIAASLIRSGRSPSPRLQFQPPPSRARPIRLRPLGLRRRLRRGLLRRLRLGLDYIGGERRLVAVLAERDRELVHARQLAEVAERELLEEETRRAVEQRTPKAFGAPDDVNEPALVQRLEHGTDVHAANLCDIGTANRLPIRHDGEGLEGGRREPRRAHRHLGALNGLGVFRARQDLPPSPDLEEFDGMAIHVVMLPQLVQRALQRGGRGFGVKCG
jgi:hypothetical protein